MELYVNISIPIFTQIVNGAPVEVIVNKVAVFEVSDVAEDDGETEVVISPDANPTDAAPTVIYGVFNVMPPPKIILPAESLIVRFLESITLDEITFGASLSAVIVAGAIFAAVIVFASILFTVIASDPILSAVIVPAAI